MMIHARRVNKTTVFLIDGILIDGDSIMNAEDAAISIPVRDFERIIVAQMVIIANKMAPHTSLLFRIRYDLMPKGIVRAMAIANPVGVS